MKLVFDIDNEGSDVERVMRAVVGEIRDLADTVDGSVKADRRRGIEPDESEVLGPPRMRACADELESLVQRVVDEASMSDQRVETRAHLMAQARQHGLAVGTLHRGRTRHAFTARHTAGVAWWSTWCGRTSSEPQVLAPVAREQITCVHCRRIFDAAHREAAA